MTLLEDIHFLASEVGTRLLERLAHENLADSQTLPLLQRLRREFQPEQARAALEMARLRLKAADKFGAAAQRLFFTREALEQASHPAVRRWRAAQFGTLRMIDACCGIGADALALAEAGAEVTGLDLDPVRVAIARHNAAALGLTAHFEVADVRDGLPEAEAVFFDPARRDAAGRRIHDVTAYIPPLATLRAWSHRLVAAKLSPGVELEQLAAYDGGVDFISVNGELKEALLWRAPGRSGLRAVLIAGEEILTWQPADALPQVGVSPPRAWLVEPDPALIRAGLVTAAAQRFGGTLLDQTIAYFTTDTQPRSPWLRAWHVLAWLPFNLKRLRAALREQDVGSVTVKKRGTAVQPDELIPRLKLTGSQSRTLILTRCRGEQIALICADIAAH